MRVAFAAVIIWLHVATATLPGQSNAQTLVAVWAHADDEGSVAPILARYAREGVKVHTIIATDGAQGAANTSVPRGSELAKLRVEEAQCASEGARHRSSDPARLS